MTIETNRLIMELDEHRRAVNREKIHPTFTQVNLEVLTPVINACAQARAEYMNCLMDTVKGSETNGLTMEQIENLRKHRMAYDELVSAANALETVIKRGYVDVK